MKKEFKTALIAIALTASVTGAFASQIKNALTGKSFISYSWQLKSRTGANIGSPIPGNENSNFAACPGGTTTVCAVGTAPGQPTLSRFYAPL